MHRLHGFHHVVHLASALLAGAEPMQPEYHENDLLASQTKTKPLGKANFAPKSERERICPYEVYCNHAITD
jgi:hypothetical protein